MLPLQRYRLSTSPATGLTGLLENVFLGDFFECFGFLSLVNKRTARTALASIMLASIPRNGVPKPPPPTAPARGVQGESWQVEDGDIQSFRTADQEQGCLGKAPNAKTQSPPQDSSTCQLWCAIALGALARGRPLAH
eukprot:g11660.t1